MLLYPIVGIGASAGGLSAFEDFFSRMPDEPNMAFVLVQHLAPDHKSLLAELIQRCTRMPVHEVTDGMAVAANCVYIIPPGFDLTLMSGTLQLLEPAAPRGQRLPIDSFFRSLALDQHERAIGIVLSGTGSDGSLGLRAIKAEGGLVLAQTLATTEFAGMPQNALNTGLVDFELEPAEMPAKLLAFAASAFGPAAKSLEIPRSFAETALKKIFALLRSHTGHDFSQYKLSTLQRRIERRLAVHQIAELGHYVHFLQVTPAEVQELFHDLLIGVTGFFRDPEAYQVLETKVIPELFVHKAPGDVVRVWSVGCSTGEEAYSLAILLHEHQSSLKQNFVLQVFATDLDSWSVSAARSGLYSASIAADVTPERLARYFVAEPDGGGYRIHKTIRDLLVFSEQDLIRDPPFSRLDLVCCRNLLIYLNADLQKRLIPLFHYALIPRGALFLGNSEGIGEHSNLFETTNRKAKLFRRLDEKSIALRQDVTVFLPPSDAVSRTTRKPKASVATRPSLRTITENALLEKATPPSALVNAQGTLLFLHGNMGDYLVSVAGEVAASNLILMAREGLRSEVTVALHKAAKLDEQVFSPQLLVEVNGRKVCVNLTIRPLGAKEGPEGPLFLVTLDGVAEQTPPTEVPLSLGEVTETRIVGLQRELREKDDFLLSALEELESSNEELKSANEEMQSVNEELQATNEELETSKEELQSVNEELATVNAELQAKVGDLSHANNDMNNLLAGTGIGTIFVDHELNILRFTPDAKRLVHLIAGDLGRNLGHIMTRLAGYDTLVADIHAVLDTLVPHEGIVQSQDGQSYKMRIQPYRTLDHVIEGAVISFVDISEVLEARRALAEALDLARLAVVVRDSHDAVTVQDLEGKMLAWNSGAERLYGWTQSEALTLNVRDRVPLPLRASALSQVHELSLAKVLLPYETQRLTKDGRVLAVTLVSTALVNSAGTMYAIATTERLQEVLHD